LLFFSSFASTAGTSTVRSASSHSITTFIVSLAFTPAPSRICRFTTMRWHPPIGISNERNAKPLIVPRTGTRARVPNTSSASNGATTAATSLPSIPSSFTLNSIFFMPPSATRAMLR
jgi:hypothetical protein